jgi:hypothetical protein
LTYVLEVLAVSALVMEVISTVGTSICTRLHFAASQKTATFMLAAV